MFPKRDAEQRLLAGYQAEDAGEAPASERERELATVS
jgi:hypothetical protein